MLRGARILKFLLVNMPISSARSIINGRGRHAAQIDHEAAQRKHGTRMLQ
jgi:hypothetical protein